MSNNFNPAEPMVYQIIRGRLDAQWADWFGGMTVAPAEGGDTLLTGAVVDQAALHGLLRQVRDLGMTLISVIPIGPGQTNATDVNP